jgi:hypothetical protein
MTEATMTYKALIGAFSLATLLVLSATAGPTPPEGWFMAGSKPQEYELGITPDGGQNRGPAGFLKSKSDSTAGFGTMMQQFSADEYRGKRVRLSAAVRSENVKGWAGLWMRVDEKNGRTSAFDNMQKRPIKGTTGWERHDVVLDVSPEAQLIALGILVGDGGAVWIDQARFEVVPESVAVTGAPSAVMRSGPVNLDFTR